MTWNGFFRNFWKIAMLVDFVMAVSNHGRNDMVHATYWMAAAALCGAFYCGTVLEELRGRA